MADAKKQIPLRLSAKLYAAIAAGAVAGQLDVGLLRRLFGLLMLYVGIKEVFARKPNEKT